MIRIHRWLGDSRRHVGLFLATAVVCYASVPIFLRYFTDYLDAWTVNGVRYGVATLVLLPYVIHCRREAPPGRNPWRDAIAPAAANVLCQIGWALAPYFIAAGIMAFVIRCSFLFTILFGFWWLPEERGLAGKWVFWLGVVLSFGGLAIMYLARARGLAISTAGWVIIVLAALFWGVYAVSVKKCMRGYPVRLSFGIISLYTAVPLLGLMFALGHWRQLGQMQLGNSALLVLSAVVGIAIAHLAYFRAIQNLGPVIAEGGMVATPFLAAFGALLLLGERLPAGQWAGGCAIVAGSLLLNLARSRSAQRDAIV